MKMPHVLYVGPNCIIVILYVPRAVANGPVGPAMAGPIIEPAIFFFLI